MSDPYDFARFLAAQDPQYSQVLNELRAGRETSHWMWYIFPQIQGLGSSDTSRYYAIASLADLRGGRRDEISLINDPLFGSKCRHRRISSCARQVL
jgi:uncharacterized protein (DUF1810 family)